MQGLQPDGQRLRYHRGGVARRRRGDGEAARSGEERRGAEDREQVVRACSTG